MERPVTRKPVNDTSVIQARSSEDRKDFNVEQAHERTVRPVIDHDDLSHESLMVNEADMDFRIPRLPHSVVKHAQRVPAFENWSRKLRTTQIDTLFNKIYDKINHLTLSVQNQSK